jgi:filamentous hemagglutinin family protein
MKAKVFSLAIVIMLLSAGWSVSHAVVTTNITTSGLGTTLNGGIAPCTSSCTITGGTKLGSNLFHSFGNFSVGTPDTANFVNNVGLPTSNSNIFSRVTGGNPSNIFGTIQTTGFGSASLYLINPAGVIFGSTASLNVGGSFHVSTADYLRMSDGNLFIANPVYEGAVTSSGPIATVLSSASPAAFGFLSPNPASITVDGAPLSVPLGLGQTNSISLVGGNGTFMREDTGELVLPGVTITGGSTINAPSGQINLVSVASPGEVLLQTMQYAPNVNGQSFTAFGNVTLSSAILDVSDNLFAGAGHAGTVLIRGGQLVLDSSSIYAQTFGDVDGAVTAVDIDMHDSITLSNGSVIFSFASAMGRGGDIAMTAPALTMDSSSVASQSYGDGDAGNISINAGTLNLTNFSGFVTQTGGLGHGGNITINADAVSLQSGATIASDTFSPDATNRGGDITFNLGAGSLSLNNGFIATTAGDQRPAGNITINAGAVSIVGPDVFSGSAIQNVTTGQGDTGNISLNVGTLLLQGTASIDIQSFTTGQTGAIEIRASESLTLSDGGQLVVTNFGGATGISGPIEVITPTLTMSNGSLISTNNTSPSQAGDVILEVGNLSITGGSRVDTETHSSGRGGDIIVSSNSVSISGAGSGLFSDSIVGSTAQAGDIQIHTNQVQMTNGATISAQSHSTGNAGNINIMASDSLVMQNNSAITTATIQSDGGDITIQAGRLVQLNDSTITTSVQGGLGNGGNIMIDPTFVILQNGQIIANAFGGNGGNITIVAGFFFADPFSVVSASSARGVSGTVNIQAPITNLSGTLAPLSEEFLQAAGLLRASCAARFQGGNISSFVVAGRDGMPLEPGGFLPSPLFIENSRSSRLAGSLNVPDLRVGRSFGEQDVTLAALSAGCAS